MGFTKEQEDVSLVVRKLANELTIDTMSGWPLELSEKFKNNFRRFQKFSRAFKSEVPCSIEKSSSQYCERDQMSKAKISIKLKTVINMNVNFVTLSNTGNSVESILS